MSWTTQLSASSLRLRKGRVCCCNVRSRSAMSNPTKSRRSWSLPPKLMKSTKLVSTCEESTVGLLRSSELHAEHPMRRKRLPYYSMWLLLNRAILPLPLDSPTSFLVSATISYQ